MKRNIFVVSVVAVMLALGSAVTVFANTGALVDFNAQYPGNTFNNSCSICHTHVPALNPYGKALLDAGGTGSVISDATFVAVEPLDSDKDGFTNLQEILAGTFPGDRKSFPKTSPSVVSIVPGDGTLGTQLTITGSGFGAKTGKVELRSESGNALLKIDKGGWTDTIISGTLTKSLPEATYDVTISPKPFATVSPVVVTDAFTVRAPELTLPLSVSSGSPGTEITIDGMFFGTKKGKVTIEENNKNKNCKVTSWFMNSTTGVSEVKFVVPKGLEPGDHMLAVTNTVGSDSTTFTILP